MVSYPLMRLSGAAAVITSFALLVVIYTILTNWSAMTNGPRTLFGIPKATTLPVTAAVALVALAVALGFKDSRTGLLLRASRDDEIAASAIGANMSALRWRAFILSALLAGIGGALWGHFITSFSPKAFYLKETFVVLGMLVIGGSTTVTGAVVGTFVVTAAFEALRALEAAINRAAISSDQVVGLTEVVLAVAMIVMLALRPGGIFPVREIGHYVFRAAPSSVKVVRGLGRSS
jgi:branched-chain amino acid transport system permease protein